MRIKKEDEILDQDKRRQIIEEINGPENKSRKNEAFKRYMCLKDKTYRYVIEQLIKQFEETTVEEMSYAMANISIAKKVINKLARVYNNGVARTVNREDGTEDEEQTKNVQTMSELMDFNTGMKKTNKFLKLQRNVTSQVCPIPCETPAGTRYKLALKILQPYLYDVIENYYNREEPMVYILSNYKLTPNLKASIDPAKENRGINSLQVMPLGDRKDQKIADEPTDQNSEKDEYIWWSNNYHFTTDNKGKTIADAYGNANTENPIKELPFVNFAIEQDGAFWAQGGEDVTDGAVLINSLITNVNHIGVIQGYGQFWMKGSSVPTTVKLGPTKVVRMEYTKEDVEPDLGYATSNAPLAELKTQIEMYVALLLTTNNLSTSGISSALSGGKDFASGIALILDKAESTEDVQEQEQIFHDKEPKIWHKVQKWQAVYDSQGLLDEEFRGPMLMPDLDVNLKFAGPTPIMSETEKLTNLQSRKNLGLNTQSELLMMDNPQLSKEEADQRLKEIAAERATNMASAIIRGINDQSNRSTGNAQQNNGKDLSGSGDEYSTGSDGANPV